MRVQTRLPGPSPWHPAFGIITGIIHSASWVMSLFLTHLFHEIEINSLFEESVSKVVLSRLETAFKEG